MDKHFFLNTGMPPHLPFDQPSMPPVWRSLTAIDGGAHFPTPATQSSDCFFNSAITSPVSASNSAISNESFVIRELIGKLGGICNSGDISPPATVAGVSSPYLSANNSCYSTPLSSPPKADIGSINRAIMESFNTHLGNSISVPPLGSNLPAMPGDPGFVERAARFSPFGSRSFNGRGNQFPCSNTPELSARFAGGGKIQRVSSSPSINGAQMAAENKTGNESGSRPGNDSNPNSRKRKSVPKGKYRDIPCSSPAKAVENGDDLNAKRSKLNEERNGEKTEEDEEEDENKKQSGHNNTNQKPPEAPKDYIHVRARRGQATDSHSLAERVRREKISERMKLLQDLVPGCNKVTGKALMLEEIINYVQSLQRQVEFLSMKVATINPRLDFNTDTLFQKDVSQPNCSMQQTYPLDGLAPTLYGGHQHPQNSLQQNGIAGSGMGPPCPNPMDPINQNHDMQLPTIDGFNNGVSELCESDLHTIVQMGFSHSTQVVEDNTFQPQSFQGSNQAPAMKTEF